MSLINQMLQDLDKRRAGEVAADRPNSAVANEIRAVAPLKHSYPIWQSVALLLFLVAGVLAWLLLHQNAVLTKPVPSPVAAQPPTTDMRVPLLKTDVQLETPPAGLPENAAAPAPKETRFAGMGGLLPNSQKGSAGMGNELSNSQKGSAGMGSLLPNSQNISPAVEPVVPGAVAPVVLEKATIQQVPERRAKPKAIEHAAVDKQVKDLSPQQRAENEYRKAIGLTQQGRLTEALDSLQQATKLDPFHLSARQMLVALLVEGKRAMEAEQILQEGLKLSPEQSGFAMLLARLQAGRGEANAALETLHRGLSYASEKADYHALYAALLQRQERHAEAVEQYQAALRTAPNSGVWLMGLGISLQAERRNKEAEDAFTRAKASNTLSSDLKAFVEQRLRQIQ